MLNNFKVSPCSRKDLRNYALLIRQKTKLEFQLEFPIVEVLEILVADEKLNLEILPDEDMPDSYGETLYTTNVIRLRESTYNGACEGNPFYRSTIAHELLHCFKHRYEEIKFCKTVEEIQSIKSYEDAEWQANCFAGELLVPMHLVKGLTVEEVVEKCKVSHSMASYQLQQYEKDDWK